MLVNIIQIWVKISHFHPNLDHFYLILVKIRSNLVNFGQFWSLKQLNSSDSTIFSIVSRKILVNLSQISIDLGQFWSNFDLNWLMQVNIIQIWVKIRHFNQHCGHLNSNLDHFYLILVNFGCFNS